MSQLLSDFQGENITAVARGQSTAMPLDAQSDRYIWCPPPKRPIGPHENWEVNQEPERIGPSTLPGSAGQVVPIPVHPVRATEFAPSSYNFKLYQMWEGTVNHVGDEEFEATLSDVTDPRQPDEEATFSKQEVSEGDLPLLVVGAVFRWSIGYETRRGQKKRVSYISFQRLPAWSEKAVGAVERAAAELQSAFPLPDSS